MAENGTLYNFGVLTKRYELISRTAGQFAPGVLGAACGFVMVLGSISMPLPFLPVLLGFWFSSDGCPWSAPGNEVRLRGSIRTLRAAPCQRPGPLGDAPDLAGGRNQHGHRYSFFFFFEFQQRERAAPQAVRIPADRCRAARTESAHRDAPLAVNRARANVRSQEGTGLEFWQSRWVQHLRAGWWSGQSGRSIGWPIGPEGRQEDPVAEHGTLYNFGVLTKRYELVSRTAGQFAPGVLGAACGFVMILGSIPMPLPFLPVLLGFWFALGRVPFGRHRGTKVRSLVGPYARYGLLRANGRAFWEMPQTWRAVGISTVDRHRSAPATDSASQSTPHRRLGHYTDPRGTIGRPKPEVEAAKSAQDGVRTAATRARSAPLRGRHPRRVRGGSGGRAGGTPETAHRGDLRIGR